MAVGKEIRVQINSIKNTQKITRAMEMVAASKMRKAQDRMNGTRPYATKMRQVVSHLAMAHPEYRHTYLDDREEKRAGYIIISSDRGLCGGLNSNLFRKVIGEMKRQKDAGVGIDLSTVGSKAYSFFARLGGDVKAHVSHMGDAPRLEELTGAIKVMLDAFDAGEIDRLYLCHNGFVNTMTQSPSVTQLLPIPPAEDDELKHHWDYLYEPEAKEVIEELLVRYVESLVYQGVVENAACEQAARMVAMKAASDNAGDMIGELQLVYNKARQAAITQEISEIVSGAAAV